MVTEKKWVYKFNEGNAQMRELLGGKGANLAEMTNLGLPIPMGFTITTEACTDYYKSGRKISNEIKLQIFEALRWLEKENGKKFGDNNDPLLVSVRSGARVSMPGMMDTILNLGMNDISVKGFAQKTNNPRFAYDSYRRFIQMFSDVVMEVPKSKFEKIIDEIKDKFERAESAVVIDYIGITVAQADAMRKKLREANVDYTVYKNTLVKRAIAGTEWEALGEVLEGPSGFAFSYDDATAPARVLNDSIKEYKKMEFKGGIVEGAVYGKEDIQAIAAIPSREVLISKFMGSIQSPIANFARVVQQIAEAKEA